MAWSCAEFERWLDDGRPRENEGLAVAHAAACARCRDSLAAARALEEALALPSATTAPAGFTDAVMRRLGAAESEGVAGDGRFGGERIVAWWARLAAEPAVVVPSTIAALMAWRWSTVWALAVGLSPRLAAGADLAGRGWAAWAGMVETSGALRATAEPAVVLGLGLAAAPLALWASWRLARWWEQAFARPLVRAGRER
ncbi:MAG TPA: hypothetical protein VL691_01870 [Vicinamibacteria bacterium]|nr:hypothetical protein [Vicinamibacteria bacterium]